jgi:hypothetical protein
LVMFCRSLGTNWGFSSVQGLFRLLKQSYWESYCLFL